MLAFAAAGIEPLEDDNTGSSSDLFILLLLVEGQSNVRRLAFYRK